MAQPSITGLTLNAGSGGSDLAVVSYAGELYQGCLACWWDGTDTVNYVEPAKPLPVGGNTVKDGSGTAYALLVDSDGNLQVDVVACASHAVTNAGTFAVQVDGAALTALEIMDDWDESNRCMVNPIVGQAGIAAGAGAVGVTVPRVTLASDDPAVAKLGTIDADTSALFGCVTGTEMQIDVVAALPAGDNNIGNVDIVTMPADTFAADAQAYGKGVLIQGDDATDRRAVLVDTDGHLQVDVLSGASGGTAYTEDIATATPIVGTATVMERDDALSALTPVEGDWAALRCSAEGALWVQDFNSDGILSDTAAIVVDLAAIEVLLGTIDTDTGNIATSLGNLDDAVDGNYLNVNVNAAGTDLTMNAGVLTAQTQRVTIATDDEVNNLLGTIDADTGAIKTALEIIDDWDDGSDHCEVVITTGSAAIGKLAANSGVDIGDVDVLSLPADTFAADAQAYGKGVLIQGDDGGDRRAVLVGTDGHLQVDVLSTASHAVTNAGTFAVQVDGNALTALQLLDDTVAVLGTATYSEATTKGNVVGAVRNDDLATLANTDNEIAPLQVNSAGALFTEPAQQVGYLFNGSEKCTIKRTTGLAASGTTAMVSAVGGKKIRGLALMLLPTSATATNVYVANDDNDILGDSSNPIRLAMDADGDNIAGVVMPWNQGGWFETDTVNEDLNLILSAAQDVIYALTYIEVS